MSEQHHPTPEVLGRLRDATDALANAALARASVELPWFPELSGEQQAAIAVLARGGVTSFLGMYSADGRASAREVLASAPPELARALSLQQTLELLRVVVDAVEGKVSEYVPADDALIIRMAALRFSRDIAFSAAQAYARAAESRGAWDARLEATVVDALLRGTSDESVLSRTAALGWSGPAHVSGMVAGSVHPATALDDVLPSNVTALPGHEGLTSARPTFGPEATTRLRRIARRGEADLLLSVQGSRLVLVIGAHSADQLHHTTTRLIEAIGAARVSVGPTVSDVREVGNSLRPAVAALQAISAWPQAPRPLHADDVLPERALHGDETARQMLYERVYLPLRGAQSPLLTTLDAYWASGTSLEATARELFVHTNTVRYRLHRVEDLIGWDPADAREGFVVRIGVAIGRLIAATQ